MRSTPTWLLVPLLSVPLGCGEEEGPVCDGPNSALVIGVIDGDTIELDTGDTVRYLLVDTPELGGDCHAEEARAANQSMVLGEVVNLEYEAEACRDFFDRRLAYVHRGDTFVNRELLVQGFAEVLIVQPPGQTDFEYVHQADFLAAETAARASSVGKWGACP